MFESMLSECMRSRFDIIFNFFFSTRQFFAFSAFSIFHGSDFFLKTSDAGSRRHFFKGTSWVLKICCCIAPKVFRLLNHKVTLQADMPPQSKPIIDYFSTLFRDTLEEKLL